MPEIIVRREFDPAPINAILNHPEVHPHIVLPEMGELDASGSIADPKNVFLVVDGGCMVFDWQEPGLYEIHTNFLPSHRGKYAYDAIQEMFRWMFTRTDCMELLTRVPEVNKAAEAMTRRCHFSLLFSRERAWPTTDGPVRMSYWSLGYEEWTRHASTLVESGRCFHDRLDLEYERHGKPTHEHPDEEAHDRIVGAAFEMILGGQPEKAVGLYNRYARFAGYGQIALRCITPPVIDIGEARLLINKPEFRVIECR